MVAANATLRDAASTASDRMQRTAEALKIAGVNAANARADADAAEVRAASLASHVKSFRTIVEDTRKTCDTVRSEHDEVSTATRSVNERLLQAESELIRVERDRNRAEEERDSLRERVEEMDCVQKLLQCDLDEKADELDKTKRLAADHEAIERARADRTQRIENELREARAMLVETTSVAAETEATTAVLNDTIRELQRENKSLHVKMEETLDQSSKERKKMNEALEKSESEAQKLRMKTISDEEEIERLKLDKQEAEKSVQQMKSRLAALEKRMASNTVIPTNYTEKATVTPPGTTEIPDGSTPPNQPFSTIQTDDSSTKGSFTIPPLRSAYLTPKNGQASRRSSGVGLRAQGKENAGGSVVPSAKCALCFKHASGIMKVCQCGKKDCGKRAHASCLASLAKNAPKSVSHPGTPCPQLPPIFCRNARLGA
jgi:septal ring factor EnvC (AmiA/AmiB activator)